MEREPELELIVAFVGELDLELELELDREGVLDPLPEEDISLEDPLPLPEADRSRTYQPRRPSSLIHQPSRLFVFLHSRRLEMALSPSSITSRGMVAGERRMLVGAGVLKSVAWVMEGMQERSR